MAVDQIIDVVSVRNRLVSALGAMPVSCFVSAAAVVRRAAVGVYRGHCDDVLIVSAVPRMLEMTVIEVIHMPFVPHRDMPAMGAMHVFADAGVVRCHCCSVP